MKIEIELPDGFIVEVKQLKSKVVIKVVAMDDAPKKIDGPLTQIKSRTPPRTYSKILGYKKRTTAGRVLTRTPAKKASSSKKSAKVGGTTSTGPKKPNVKY